MAKNFLGSDKVFSISTKGRYALRVMVDLAEQDSTKFITLEEIAVRQEISKKYLEAVLRSLVQNNLLEVLRGRGGGYRLTRKPEEYSVGEILELAEGICLGVISYTILHILNGEGKKVTPLMYVLTVLFILKYALL